MHESLIFNATEAMPYLNRRVDLKRFGALSLLPPLLFAQTEVSTGFLRKHPAFYLHCHPGLVNMRGRGQYEGCQAFTKTTSDMRARGLTAAFFSRVADASILKKYHPLGMVPARSFSAEEAWADLEKQLNDFGELTAREKISLAISGRQME